MVVLGGDVWEVMILGQTFAVLNVSGAADKTTRGL